MLGMLTDFGYNHTAPREVATRYRDREKLAELVSSVYTFKLTVFILLTLLVLLLGPMIPQVSMGLLAGGLIFLLNLTLTPNWFFQGVERMQFIAIIDLLAKIVFTVSIFIVVKTPADFIYVLPMWGMGGIFSAVVGMRIIYRQYGIRYVFPGMGNFAAELKAGYSLFISNVSTHIITNSQILILGALQAPSVVGLYAIAEKLIRIPWILGGLFSQVMYPRVCKLQEEGQHHVRNFFKQWLPVFYVIELCIVVVLWIFAREIISYFTKESIDEAVIVLRVLAISVLLIVANIPFQIILLAKRMDKMMMRIFSLAAVVNLVITAILVYVFSYTGAAIGSVVTMAVLLISFIYVTKRKQEKVVNHE
jgi:PST family polysaccharide transporter